MTTPLFIPSLLSKDWNELQSQCTIIFIFWFLVLFAILLDLWSGVNRAKALKEEMRSDKFRRTMEKIGDYWRVLAFGLMLDVVGSMLTFYNIPYASGLASVACILIELKSVIENAHAKKSAVSQLPDMIRKIISCTNSDEAMKLIAKIHELSDKNSNENKENE